MGSPYIRSEFSANTKRQKITKNNLKSIMSFTFNIRAIGLPVMDKGLEGDSADPYFKLYVEGDKIYTSDKIKNTLNPNWEEFTLERDEISGTPKITDIKMVVKDADFGNKDDTIGQLYFKIMDQNGPLEALQGITLKNDDDEEVGTVFIKVEENE